GWQNAPLRIPIAGPAQSVIVAHRLLASGVSTGGPVGEPIAGYVFAYQNGDEEHIPIRDRFEIAEIPTAWGQLPFRAVPDQSDSLPAREVGRFDESGERQAEVNQAELRGYYLWAWQNPHPEQPLAPLSVIPAGPCFLIAGVTLGYSDEYPFVRSGARPFKITITDSLAATRPFDLAVAVDRDCQIERPRSGQRVRDGYLEGSCAGANKGIFIGVAESHACDEKTRPSGDDGERRQRLLRMRVLPGPQIVTTQLCLVHLRLALTTLVKAPNFSRR